MTNDAPFCNKCITAMKRSTAFVNDRMTGKPDFIGDDEVCTVSPDVTTASLFPCWKCPACGHSIRIIIPK